MSTKLKLCEDCKWNSRGFCEAPKNMTKTSPIDGGGSDTTETLPRDGEGLAGASGSEFAFPTPDTYYPNGQIQYGTPGMTLRDYFAAKAMLGYCACPSTVDSWSVETTVEQAYRIADAMLEFRIPNAGTERRTPPKNQ